MPRRGSACSTSTSRNAPEPPASPRRHSTRWPTTGASSTGSRGTTAFEASSPRVGSPSPRANRPTHRTGRPCAGWATARTSISSRSCAEEGPEPSRRRSSWSGSSPRRASARPWCRRAATWTSCSSPPGWPACSLYGSAASTPTSSGSRASPTRRSSWRRPGASGPIPPGPRWWRTLWPGWRRAGGEDSGSWWGSTGRGRGGRSSKRAPTSWCRTSPSCVSREPLTENAPFGSCRRPWPTGRRSRTARGASASPSSSTTTGP